MFQFLFPHYRINSVLELTKDWLRQEEINTLFLDVDSTLKFYRSALASEEILEWVEELRKNKVRFYLISNGRAKRIKAVAEQLNVEYIAPAFKPLPFGCRKALRLRKLDPQYVAMVGDQLFTDIVAGNLAGIRTILVKPMRPEQEPLFTRIKRPFERWMLKLDRVHYDEQ